MLSDEAVKEVESLSTKSYEEIYESLGVELIAHESEASSKETFGLDSMTEEPRQTRRERAFQFVRRIWKELVPKLCDWWQNNKGTIVDQLTQKVNEFIQAIVPPRYRGAEKIIKWVISALMKYVKDHGMEFLCNTRPDNPPT